MTKRIAIVGGGIAGLYTAWRLLLQNQQVLQESAGEQVDELPFLVHLYEKEEELGGRIRSQKICGIPFRAELGAMRFRRSHVLLNALLKQLKIPTRPFNLPSPVFYVRGRRLTSSEITKGRCSSCHAEGPFHLKPCEQGMSAVELIRYAINGILHALNFPTLHQGKARQLKRKIKEEDFDEETWYYIKEEGIYQGLHLYSIGFWNLLQHFLSNEAYVMVHDVLSLESILGNWNAAEAIPWFLADFASDQFDMVPGGLSLVAERLDAKIRKVERPDGVEELDKWKRLSGSIEIRCDQNVREIDLNDGLWTVTSVTCPRDDEGKYRRNEDGSKVEIAAYNENYDNVILALPASALNAQNGFKVSNNKEPFRNPDWPPRWLGWVSGHRMIKIFLLYAEPWWMGDNFPGYDTGRIFTDLPLRQIYHFSPTWIQTHGEMQKLDGAIALQTEPAKGKKEMDEGGLALLMASYSDEHYVSFWEPMLEPDPKLKLIVDFDQPYIQPSPKLDKRVWEEMWSDIKKIVMEHPELLAKRRMVEKVHLLLQEIHGREIPHPILGIARDWDAGWHTWIVGSKPWEEATRKGRVQPLDGLFLCGEAYSPEQGWIEGALKSSEQVLEKLKVGKPKWLEGLHMDFNSYINPYKWLDDKTKNDRERHHDEP